MKYIHALLKPLVYSCKIKATLLLNLKILKMKTNYFLLLSILFLCFACQKNDDFESDNVAVEKKINESNNRGVGGASSFEQSREAFESMMQWTSYLTAQALYYDSAAESQFISVLQSDISSPNKIISLEDLLGHNVSNSSFRLAFREQFFHYVDIDCDNTGGGFGPLEGSPKPHPPIEIADPNNCDLVFANFLTALLDNNCLEFYLPLGYDASDNNWTSTAHTLTTSLQNECYLHPIDTYTTTLIKISNLNTYHNPIMVRPIRKYGPMFPDCMYPDYAGIDFSLFLDN